MRLVSSHMPHPCLQIKKRCGALLSLSVAGQRSAAVVNVHEANADAPLFYAAVCPPFERLEGSESTDEAGICSYEMVQRW